VFHARRLKFIRATCNSAFCAQVGCGRKNPARRRPRDENKIFKTIMSLHTPDLTKFPPRSPRVRLGGYAILPRCVD